MKAAKFLNKNLQKQIPTKQQANTCQLSLCLLCLCSFFVPVFMCYVLLQSTDKKQKTTKKYTQL